MPHRAWNAKRERQYELTKDSAKQRGEAEDTAEEIAARTVNRNGPRQAKLGRRRGCGVR